MVEILLCKYSDFYRENTHFFKKVAVLGRKMYKMCDFMSKMREITHFQHQITLIRHEFTKKIVLLHQNKDFNG